MNVLVMRGRCQDSVRPRKAGTTMERRKPSLKRKSIRVLTPPPGFSYQAGFLSELEQADTLRALERMTMKPVFMRGVSSLRRVAHFGWTYDYQGWSVSPTDPIPDFIRRFMGRAETFAGTSPGSLEQVLVTFYPAGAGIGWHRDAAAFGEPVVGLSFRTPCPMRFRRSTASGYDLFEQTLDPGSIYAIAGPARSAWQHGIIKAPSDRYSITFRTLRRRPDQPGETTSLARDEGGGSERRRQPADEPSGTRHGGGRKR